MEIHHYLTFTRKPDLPEGSIQNFIMISWYCLFFPTMYAYFCLVSLSALFTLRSICLIYRITLLIRHERASYLVRAGLASQPVHLMMHFCINKSSKEKRVNSFLFIYIKRTSIHNKIINGPKELNSRPKRQKLSPKSTI